MGIHEVTQGQFKALMGFNPSFCSPADDGKKGAKYDFGKPAGGKDKLGAGYDPDRYPVENVRYEEAKEYCDKLSGLAKEKENNRRYRLPTEAEWEYACRGGAATKSATHFGQSLSSKQANFNGNIPYGGAEKGPNLERTCPVGSYEPNGYGLYDMHGNVWEWCSDWYTPNYYTFSTPADPLADPPGPSEGSARVIRGGAWFYPGRDCRSACRWSFPPPNAGNCVGFRLVLVPSR